MQQRSPAATVVAVLALVVALCGTSLAGYAAGKANGDSVIKKRSLSGNRLKADTVTGAQVAESGLGTVPSATQADRATQADTVPAPAFHPLQLGPGIVPNAQNRPPGWRKDASGFVHLEGAVGFDSSEEVIATLPPEARPAARATFLVYQQGGPAIVQVQADGVVGLGDGNTNTLALDAISFYAGP
jgi:hypothetical protein